MKKYFSIFFLPIIVLFFFSAIITEAESLTIDWSSKIRIPTASEISAYNKTTANKGFNSRSPYIGAWWDTPAEGFSEISIDFISNHQPKGIYYCILQWSSSPGSLSNQCRSIEGGDTVGYAGFQVDNDGIPTVIMSIWDTYCEDYYGNRITISPKILYPDVSKCRGDGRFGGEGEGAACSYSFPWKANHPYRAYFQHSQEPNRNATILFWLQDLETDEWTLLFEYEINRRDSRMTSGCSFLENFWENHAGEVRSMVLSNIRSQVPGSGKWTEIKQGYFNQDFDLPGSYNYGADGSAFWFVTTGLPNRASNPLPRTHTITGAGVSPVGISVKPTSATIEAGESITLTATIIPSDSSNKKVTWTSSNTNVATVYNGVVTGQSAGTVTITAASAANPSLKAARKITVENTSAIRDFVKRCYRLILGREADQSGLEFWTNKLKGKDYDAAKLMQGFIYSKEFQSKKYPNKKAAEILYRTMLDRAPDANGLAFWTGLLDDGVSYRYIINGFAKSTEFKDLCINYGITTGSVKLTENRDKNLKVTQFVSRNYRIALGRKGDADGLNFWTGKILNKSATPQQVAYKFVFSKECINKKLNNTNFVKMLYNLYMGRNADKSGLNFWLGKLSQGYSRETIATKFGESKEFTKIVASYGLK